MYIPNFKSISQKTAEKSPENRSVTDSVDICEKSIERFLEEIFLLAKRFHGDIFLPAF